MNNLNILNNDLSISKQREKLLKLNPDLLYGVYEIKTNLEDGTKYDGEEQDEIRLELLDNTLTCYPNQLDNLKGLNENQDILIVDLNELRKGKFKILAGKNNNDLAENITNLCLLSNGVIEIIKSEYKDSNGKVKERVHIPLSSRDGGAADINQKTTVAGRNFGSNLIEELEEEYTEENPILGKKDDGNYYLFTPYREKEKSKNALKNAVNLFLQRKYNLNKNNPQDVERIKKFERNFKGIKYEDLGDILKNIIKNDRIDYFESKGIDSFEVLEKQMKKVSIVDGVGKTISSGNFYVFYDEKNNTFEYRQLREIKLPKGVNPRQRLYLESENQGIINPRAENLPLYNLVPTVQHFSDKINKKL